MKKQQGHSSRSHATMWQAIKRKLISIGFLAPRNSAAESTTTRATRAVSKWGPRRSVVASSLALLVGGTLLTTTALPVSAVAPTAKLTPYAASLVRSNPNLAVGQPSTSTSTSTPNTLSSSTGTSKGTTSTTITTRRSGAFRSRRHQVSVTTTTLVVPPFLTTTTSTPITVTRNAPPATTTTTVPATTTTSSPPVTTTTNAPPVTTTTGAPSVTTTTGAPPVTTTTGAPVVAPLSTTGIADTSEPSGFAPPAANALPGYSRTYVTDFGGSTLPSGWSIFTGVPGGDPGAQWASNHVTVNNGMLQLNTFQDSAYNNEWVAGGVCQCGLGQTYRAYFVRSRLTGPGPTGVQLLWPVANVWPPEIDFNETGGGTGGTAATVHFGSSNSQVQRNVNIDMTQWHTWGVIWTPTSVTYTVDGRAWGTVTDPSQIPSQAMTLDIDQQTWCQSGWACPTAPQSQLVDWVAEYTAN